MFSFPGDVEVGASQVILFRSHNETSPDQFPQVFSRQRKAAKECEGKNTHFEILGYGSLLDQVGRWKGLKIYD